MTAITTSYIQAWKISYNAFIDLFQIYDKDVFSIPDDNLYETHIGNTTVLFSKESNTPMLIQIKSAYACLGDIDKMNKSDIIRKVIGCLKNHAE